MGPDVVATDNQIFAHAQLIVNKLDQNQKLQQLAKSNGLDVKNAYELTDENKEKIAVATTALMLAKRSGDPKYDMLVRQGLQKRSLKAEIINSYKEEAKQLLSKCERNMVIDV